jgi:Domain of unknown function (DUF5668)
MSHYIMIRRLRGPAILLLIGGVWLLRATGVINHPWSWFWPLLLIMIGVFMLAERITLAAEGGYPMWPYPGQPYSGANPGSIPGAAPQPSQADSSSTVSASSQEFGKNFQGGKP